MALAIIEFASGDPKALPSDNDIPALKGMKIDELKSLDKNEMYIGGYPNEVIVSGEGMAKSRYFHYGKSGVFDMISETDDSNGLGLLIHSLDCSPG